MLVSGPTIRAKRIAAEIPADLVSLRTGVDRARLSRIERGLISASSDELERLTLAIEDLAQTKRLIHAYASSLGWPGTSRAIPQVPEPQECLGGLGVDG